MTRPLEKNQNRAQRKNHAADDATSIVILPTLSDFAKGDRCLRLKPAEGHSPSSIHENKISRQITVTRNLRLV